MLNPLLFTLTHNCATKFESNIIVKFTDDTLLVGLITKDDGLMSQQQPSPFILTKQKDGCGLFSRSADHTPLFVGGSEVEKVRSIKIFDV